MRLWAICASTTSTPISQTSTVRQGITCLRVASPYPNDVNKLCTPMYFCFPIRLGWFCLIPSRIVNRLAHPLPDFHRSCYNSKELVRFLFRCFPNGNQCDNLCQCLYKLACNTGHFVANLRMPSSSKQTWTLIAMERIGSVRKLNILDMLISGATQTVSQLHHMVTYRHIMFHILWSQIHLPAESISRTIQSLQ